MAGFAVLLFSPMPIIQDFGLITAITVLFSLILAIMVLPVLLIGCSRRDVPRRREGLDHVEGLNDIVHHQPLFTSDQGIAIQGVIKCSACFSLGTAVELSMLRPLCREMNSQHAWSAVPDGHRSKFRFWLNSGCWLTGGDERLKRARARVQRGCSSQRRINRAGLEPTKGNVDLTQLNTEAVLLLSTNHPVDSGADVTFLPRGVPPIPCQRKTSVRGLHERRSTP